MLHKVKGFLFAVLVYLSSSLGIIFFAGWCLPIVFFSRRLFRAVMDFHVGFWFNYAAVSTRDHLQSQLHRGDSWSTNGSAERAFAVTMVVVCLCRHRTDGDTYAALLWCARVWLEQSFCRCIPYRPFSPGLISSVNWVISCLALPLCSLW